MRKKLLTSQVIYNWPVMPASCTLLDKSEADKFMADR